MKRVFISLFAVCLSLLANAQNYLEYCNAGDACMNNEDYQGAVTNYVKALELDASHEDYTTAQSLGLCYEKMGEMEKAGDAYKDSFFRGNFDTNIINNMRKCYEAANCTDCLKNGYKEIAEKFPEQELAMAKRLYNIYAKEGDNFNCLLYTEKMLEDPDLSPENQLKYLKNAASFALKLDSTDIAESYYEKVLAIVPNDADIHKALGFGLYNQIQKIDKNARAAYEAKQKQGKVTQHDYSMMLTAAKRATLKYGPKAIEHLRIVNQTTKDPDVAKVIAQLQNNIAAYSK